MRKRTILLLLIVIAVVITVLWPAPAEGPAKAPVARTLDPDTQRDTATGPVIGARDADDTYAWLGIPFAAPPLGDLRWRAPQPVEPWTEPLAAITFRDPCVQLSGPLDGLPDDSGAVVGSEDCLYLNIWAPRSHSNADDAPVPVMLWIHGGGNTIGTANTYPANRLASDGEVVVVTINYRLGFLGWMSHPALRTADRTPLDASGNYGNLDMIAALEWVRDNIASFGGDPGNVTIFGESAGGRNVYALMASPLAEGLFHRAIAQSGMISTMPLWRAENFRDDEQPGMALSSREWLLMQLQHAGRATDRDGARTLLLSMSPDEIAGFMYSRNAAQLLEGISGGAGMYRAPQVFRDGTVIPQRSLLQLFRSTRRYNQVPLMTGTNRDEAKLFLAQDPDHVKMLFWFLPRPRDEEAYNRAAAYISDNWKAQAVDEPIDIIVKNSVLPVYAYRWDWDEGANNWLVDYSELLGAAHGLEVPYIFHDFEGTITAPGLYNRKNISGRDLLAAQMRSYWAEFAWTGSPGRGRNGDLPEWKRWTTFYPNLMLLDTEAGGGPRMVKEPMTVAMLKKRVAEDPHIEDLRTRCTLHVNLFLQANSGDDHWEKSEYDALGCAKFDPWTLAVER
jgi:para-nitrobenzyl esterase